MRNLKKLASLLLALVMVFSLATTAFAADSYTITISNTTDDYEYAAYQIFKGVLSEDGKTLSNVSWGGNVDTTKLEAAFANTAFAGKTDVKDVMDILDNDSTTDNATAKAFAEAIAKCLKGTAFKSDDKGNTYAITVDAAGYYLVENTKVPAVTTTAATGSYTRYILEVVNDVTVNHKGTVPEVDKVIVDNGEAATNEASIGDTVSYKITGKLPSNIADYDTYYYVFTDTLSKGLTYTPESLTVKIGNVDVTDYFYVSVGTYSEAAGTSIKVGIQDLLDLNDVDNVAISASTEIVIEYSAVLNEKAEIGTTTGNKNDVKLDYSNDPNRSGVGDNDDDPPPTEPSEPTPDPNQPHGETPKQEVITYTTQLTITKIDGKTNNILPGAEFTLTTTDGATVALVSEGVYEAAEEGTTGEYYKLNDGTYTKTAPTDATKDKYDNEGATTYNLTTVITAKGADKTETSIKGMVDAAGKITFTGLGAGTYTLSETKTPNGYNTAENIQFTISFNPTTNAFSSNNTLITVDSTAANGTLIGTVQNFQGSTLPTTGGIGTTLFYVFGGILVVAAVVLLVTKKRMNAAE